MSKRKGLVKAFPSNTWQDSEGTVFHGSEGMNLRDFFAAKAMQGMITCPDVDLYKHELAKHAYAYADAMLAARKEGA